LFSGIISGVIGGTVVAAFSTSKYSVSGPAAGLTAIVISSIATLGSFEIFLAALVFAGVFQIILGFIKAGGIGNYIPNAVIKGMLAGIGIILIIKEVPHLVGYDKDPEGDMEFIQIDGENTFTELLNMINFITPGSIIIGVISFAIILIGNQKFYKKDKILSLIPAPLLVVVFGMLLTISFSNYDLLKIDSQHMVNIPKINSFADLKSNIVIPNFSSLTTKNFWIIALTIAIVASIETLLSIEAVDKLDPEKNQTNSNKELMAQGVGNITCGFFGGLPITSVIVRSSANINAGAKSKLSSIIHGIFLLVCAIALPNLLNYIPNSCLAAILILTGYKLTNFKMIKGMIKSGIEQSLPFFITIIVMLITDLLKGVCAGLVIAVIFIIRDNIKSSFDSTNQVIDGKMYYIIKLPQHLTFFNKGFLINYFSSVEKNSMITIDYSINKKINSDAKDVIDDFIQTSSKKKITVELIKHHN
jgi:MFS superfamily sulfate permease-like transporter